MCCLFLFEQCVDALLNLLFMEMCVLYQTRPTPPHLTSAMAENILAAACESETRNAAKRMRMDVYQTHVSNSVCVLGRNDTFLKELYSDST